MRSAKIDVNERFFIETASHLTAVNEEEIVEGAIDTDEHADFIQNLFAAEGSKVLLMQYQEDDPPAHGKFSTLKLNFLFWSKLIKF